MYRKFVILLGSELIIFNLDVINIDLINLFFCRDKTRSVSISVELHRM